MANNRDNFTKKTIEILAKRVGFFCSNPNCKIPTVGPNSDQEKATTIGIAAHITAASPGGPRYDANLTSEQRKHITNGIWLCGNCASLIDKDEENYPVELIHDWKKGAEQEMTDSLQGKTNTTNQTEKKTPFLEADLIWSSGARIHKGWSPKNRQIGDGIIRPGTGTAIILWELNWNFSLAIYNNSSSPAFNVRLEHVNGNNFSFLTGLPKINNLPPYQNLDLVAKYKSHLEGNANEAEAITSRRVPEDLIGLEYDIIYQDEERVEHRTRFSIIEDEITNVRT